ncbi:DNA mismatch repair protein MutS2 [Prevotella sp. tc2-28]|uniref:endonuclease MutS2 n=1 Tax=Prevotella sp. tc2-28 TaxID=1761888 RepID=UPI00089B084F|nr:Smr/MutS family protein [Prevotella sp. tc2-28]SDZ89869.1 DNA mismatch repair protein MutS2 [Prevotella sp. tc2-28]
MIYPKNYESKIGFDEIRQLLKEHCLSTLGKEKADEMTFSDDADTVNEWMSQIREFRRLMQSAEQMPMNYFFDVRESVARIRLENTHLDEDELFDLRRSLETIGIIVNFLNKNNGDDENPEYPYPSLRQLAKDVQTFPAIIRRIDSILDKFGKIKDSATMILAGIRHDMEQTAGSISRTLYTILHSAQREGLVAQDVAPTLRDGRLVIPVAPGLKRRIKGIVHDESATGKTVFIEPTEVVEANNKVRELEAAERREIIRILTVFSDELRPHVQEVLDSYQFLATIDLIHAKAEMAEQMQAFEPQVSTEPHIDWIRAVHPLLQRSLAKQDKKAIPLDIILTKEKRLLIISGPNAGGKSVCLKTVGLLQYMLQCGLSIPVGDRSTVGLFQHIMIDIGDEQSIADDLSTYSSHLLNMKNMMKQANARTLLLIDEFGGGTEPTIGGAIAEAVLKQFWKKQTFAIITTHYQNLKHFAEDHEGVVNGAMLYDRHQMQALFQLSIGQPGSSFAIEIARKTGIPEEVINDASEIVGSDYIQSDKYLQDIVRDKRYWEGKRQTIHQHEKRLEATGERLDASIEEIERERKAILRRAKEQAEELLKEANRKIENAIRDIKEAQAEKEQTRLIREELNQFREQVVSDNTQGLMSEEDFAKKLRQMEERKARKAQRKEKKGEEQRAIAEKMRNSLAASATDNSPLKPGDTVRIKGMDTIGKLESLSGKNAVVIFGDVKTKMKTDRLEHATKPKEEKAKNDHSGLAIQTTRMTSATIEDRKQNFHQDIDVRGMRGDEAVDAVMHFIDDAILVGMSRVRILHGTGTGILRQLIRQYLNTVPNVKKAKDEHVQFGGAGITVVDLD